MFLAILFLLLPIAAHAENYLESTSFTPCINVTQFKFSDFQVSITPENKTYTYFIDARSSFAGNGTLDFSIIVNGTQTQLFKIDPCLQFGTVFGCPFSKGELNAAVNGELPNDAAGKLPEELYTTSDLDAQFRLELNDTATGQPFGCVQANLTNGVIGDGNGTAPSGDTTDSTTTGSTNDTIPKDSASAAAIHPNVLGSIPMIIGMLLMTLAI